MTTKLNKIVFTSCMAIASPLVFAATSIEEVETSTPRLGIQAGADFQNAHSPGQLSTNTFTGFTVGMNLPIPITPEFAIQPEFNYSRRGLNLVNNSVVQANVTYHSIEVPVFAKGSFGGNTKFNIFAGPQAIWNISNSVTAAAGGNVASVGFNPRTVDLAGTAGIGVDINDTFFANARYSVGFVDISSDSADWYSRGFKLLAGVHL